MKRSIVFSSLATSGLALILFLSHVLFLSHRNNIPSSSHQSTHEQTIFDRFLSSQPNTAIALTHPHEWPANMYKDALLYSLHHHDSHVLDKNYLVPFFLMANKEHAKARQLLQNGTTDADLAELLTVNPEAHDVFATLNSNNRGKNFFTDLADYLAKIEVTPSTENEYRNIPYHSYYADKKQNLNLENIKEWNDKQKGVYQILNKYQPKTVLDLGANLGWFSLLAHKLNAKVIATDIDEFCMNMVYLQTKEHSLSVMPTVIPFHDMTHDVARLKSDVVLCLALIHHLVFVAGIKLENIMSKLAKLTNRILILEFIDIEDAHIQRALKTPSRFKNGTHEKIVSMYNNYAKEQYTQTTILNLGKKYFKESYILPSEKDSRKLIILIK